MTLNEDDQFDVLSFLSQGPKVIADFRKSKSFWVEDLGRGVYPRSLLDMLIDMEFVSKFRPYQSADEEIEGFINNLGDGISDDRKKVLSRYTSFQLTDYGKEILGSSDARAMKEDKQETTITETFSDEPKGMGEPKQNKALNVFLEEEPDLYTEEDLKVKYESSSDADGTVDDVEIEELPKETAVEAPKKETDLEQEIALVEGDRDEDENEDLLQMSARIIHIDKEIGFLQKELDDAGFLSKRKIQKQIDELLEEKKLLEKQTKDF